MFLPILVMKMLPNAKFIFQNTLKHRMTNFKISTVVKRRSDSSCYNVITQYKTHYTHDTCFKRLLYTIYIFILATTTDSILKKYSKSKAFPVMYIWYIRNSIPSNKNKQTTLHTRNDTFNGNIHWLHINCTHSTIHCTYV